MNEHTQKIIKIWYIVSTTALLLFHHNTQSMEYHTNEVESLKKLAAQSVIRSNIPYQNNVNIPHEAQEFIDHNKDSVFKQLLKKNPIGFLTEAIAHSNINAIAYAIQNDSRIGIKFLYCKGRSVLHEAVIHNNEFLVSWLLDNNNFKQIGKKVNPDTLDVFRLTPLHIAAKKGLYTIANQLILAEATIDAQDCLASTPLHYATINNKKNIVGLLLFFNARITMQDCLGNTPLHQAALKGHTSIVEELLNYDPGMIRNVKNKFGQTALHYAAQKGFLNIVSILLKRKIYLDKGLFAHCANPNDSDCKGNTPLHYAAKSGNISVIEELLKFNADPNITNIYCETPLHKTAESGKRESIELLLKAGANPNLKTIYNQTVYDIASANGLLPQVCLSDEECENEYYSSGSEGELTDYLTD